MTATRSWLSAALLACGLVAILIQRYAVDPVEVSTRWIIFALGLTSALSGGAINEIRLRHAKLTVPTASRIGSAAMLIFIAIHSLQGLVSADYRVPVELLSIGVGVTGHSVGLWRRAERMATNEKTSE